MKIISFILLLFPILSWGQAGQIRYTEIVQLEIELPEGQEHMRDMLPSEQKSERILLFDAEQSLYKNYTPPADVEASADTEGGQIRIRMMAPDNATYINRTTGDFLEMQEFLGKRFLIEDELTKRAWKVGTEQQVILDHVCRKATYQDTSIVVEAWFAPSLATPVGPADYQGLPGAILLVNIDSGRVVMQAETIELQDQLEEPISAPSKGKQMSRPAFETMVDEKMKEMEENGGMGIRVRRG